MYALIPGLFEMVQDTWLVWCGVAVLRNPQWGLVSLDSFQHVLEFWEIGNFEGVIEAEGNLTMPNCWKIALDYLMFEAFSWQEGDISPTFLRVQSSWIYIADTSKSTIAKASFSLHRKLTTSLKATNSTPVRGEDKSWIYQNYLAPSFYYYDTTIKKLEASATRIIKKWLKLLRNATQAVLYHMQMCWKYHNQLPSYWRPKSHISQQFSSPRPTNSGAPHS